MKISALQQHLIGEWIGTSRLWRNWLPDKETSSESRLGVNTVANGKFLTFAYTWSLEGTDHDGFLLTGNENDEDKATGAWGDSWHQGGSLLSLDGNVSESGEIVLNGTFPASPEPDWGWRITIAQPTPHELRITMHVIPWNQAEELAALAEYTRKE